VGWHLNDPPRSAAALPLAGVPAWRGYLGLPMHRRRQLAGGLQGVMRLGYNGAGLRAVGAPGSPAGGGVPAGLAELAGRRPGGAGPIGLLGASIGALPAQLVMADRLAPVSAAVLISP